MIKKVFIPVATALALSLFCVNGMAENAVPAAKNIKIAELKKSPPFLIMGKMPHMTKQVMQAWDKPEFNLSEDQKSKLLVIRQETLAGAHELAMKINPLELEVASGIFSGKTPEELAPLVQKIAALKAEATMLHLRCIVRTTDVLDDNQGKFLKSM